ncbi:MAG TPA: metallophosphoesterase [Mucilaginibacter sp.]|nr:metallophosphoesterase [Mucilaginibacter sp.]
MFAQTKQPVIDFTSDTQGPLFAERIIHKLNHNEKATALIFNDINKRHPTGLFILGDLVSLGFENQKWKSMDAYLKLLKNNGVPVYAALGNHELMVNAAEGAKKFQSRFPMHDPAGYVEIIDSVAVILLNSNFTKIKSAAIEKQDTWYKNALHQLDSAASVKFVIVGCHHSPFTNSEVVKASLEVQQKFVAPFLKSKKCVLFLSGHSHNFENFKVDGKQFLVIGGGGGIHQPLYPDKQKFHDLSGNYKPMFHYIEVTRIRDSLQVTSRRLKADFSGFENGLTINL